MSSGIDLYDRGMRNSSYNSQYAATNVHKLVGYNEPFVNVWNHELRTSVQINKWIDAKALVCRGQHVLRPGTTACFACGRKFAFQANSQGQKMIMPPERQ